MIAIVVLETTELSLSLSYAHTVSLHTVAIKLEVITWFKDYGIYKDRNTIGIVHST